MSWDQHDNLGPGDHAKRILKAVGAFYADDHVVLTSGRHSDAYVNHDPLFEQRNMSMASELGGLLASALIKKIAPGHGMPSALVGPMTGGWHLAHWTGHHYRVDRWMAPSVCAEKGENGTFVLSPKDAETVKGQKVIIIDDVLTTGKSARATLDAVHAAGGTCLGLLVVCDRSGKTATELGFENVWSLFTLEAKSWTADECPMCKAGKRVNTQVGHGAEFMLSLVQPKS